MASLHVTETALRELGAGSGALTIGGIHAEDLAARFGTPLYVYDSAVAQRRLAAVQAAFGPRVAVLYALKANPCAALAAALRERGAGAEVASAGEILVARAAGFAAADTQFAGPGKDERDLALALDPPIGALNVESPAEYEKIATLAAQRGVRPRVALRVNPATPSGSRLRMSGGGKKFGIDPRELGPLVRHVGADARTELVGLHVYAGTQCFDAGAFLENAAALVEMAHELEAATPMRLATLDFGGGFGVPSFESDPTFDLDAAGRGIVELIAGDAAPARRYFVELGRYLVAPAGVYLTRVLYLKESGGKRHAILDGGMHHHGAAAGMGAVIRRPYPIVLCREPRAPAEGAFTLGGPLCTPADEFAADAGLPALRRGDVLAILVSGAYGLTFSNVMFLSHPTPAEVVVEQRKARLARERGLPEDALRGQHL